MGVLSQVDGEAPGARRRGIRDSSQQAGCGRLPPNMNFYFGGSKTVCCNETLGSTPVLISWNWAAFFSPSTGASHGKRVSYFGESRIPFSKSLVPASLLMGCPVFWGFFFFEGGQKCTSV